MGSVAGNEPEVTRHDAQHSNPPDGGKLRLPSSGIFEPALSHPVR